MEHYLQISEIGFLKFKMQGYNNFGLAKFDSFLVVYM